MKSSSQDLKISFTAQLSSREHTAVHCIIQNSVDNLDIPFTVFEEIHGLATYPTLFRVQVTYSYSFIIC